MLTDGQTGVAKLIVAFRHFANAPKSVFLRLSTLNSESQLCVQMVPKPLTFLSPISQHSFFRVLNVSQGPL
jgi:hypothetical protein